MMQQRLKAKLMVARWGASSAWGRLGEAKFCGKGAEGRALQIWGHSVGLARSGNEIFVPPFPLDAAEKSIFINRGTSALLPMALTVSLKAQGHKHGCDFV